MSSRALTRWIQVRRAELSRTVIEEFLRRHPVWIERYGDAARTKGIDDIGFHLDALAGALTAASPEAFGEYMRWNVELFTSRGIAPDFLVETLALLESTLGADLTPGERAVLRPVIAAGQAAVDTAEVAPIGTSRWDTPRADFVAALLAGDRVEAVRLASRLLDRGEALAEVYANLVQAALYEVGRRWQTGVLSVAQEHLATAVAQFVLATLYSRLEPGEPRWGRMVVTGVNGEMHQVGALMIADVLEADGWDVRFLGTNLPHAGILDVLESHQASVLGLSTTLLANVPQAVELATAVRERFGDRVRLLVGGAAFRIAPQLRQEVGAAVYGGDVTQAVLAARTLSVGAS